ncbi:MAG: helix-turn-helix domain-containing protein, partial [Isosphaeraceae bacterium]
CRGNTTEPPCPAASPTPSSGMSLKTLERQHILRAMEAEGGNKVRVARALGISRRRLYRLLEKQGLDGPATA